jgi:hypothetical protein
MREYDNLSHSIYEVLLRMTSIYGVNKKYATKTTDDESEPQYKRRDYVYQHRPPVDEGKCSTCSP